jgi:hypothetical protein
MQTAQRDALVSAASSVAQMVAVNNAEAVKAKTIAQYAQDFSGIANTIRDAAPHLNGASFVPETVWLLDASGNKQGADGSAPDAQFFCTLNRGGSPGTSFLIPSLPPGKYGLVVMDTAGITEPWQVAVLMKESAPGTWQLGGLFPRATTAGGHDGLWFWKTARDYAAKKQPWNAYVYYTEAEQLLRPVSFLTSAHLDLLQGERNKSAPAALSGGLGPGQPLVIGNGTGEVRVTAIGAEKAPGAGVDLLIHIAAQDALADPVASRARNAAAAKAVVKQYPELRSAFHGVWVVADLPGGGNYVSEEPMTSL